MSLDEALLDGETVPLGDIEIVGDKVHEVETVDEIVREELFDTVGLDVGVTLHESESVVVIVTSTLIVGVNESVVVLMGVVVFDGVKESEKETIIVVVKVKLSDSEVDSVGVKLDENVEESDHEIDLDCVPLRAKDRDDDAERVADLDLLADDESDLDTDSINESEWDDDDVHKTLTEALQETEPLWEEERECE